MSEPDVRVTVIVEIHGRRERFTAAAETTPDRGPQGTWAGTGRRLVNVVAGEADEWLAAVDKGLVPINRDTPTAVVDAQRHPAHAVSGAPTAVIYRGAEAATMVGAIG